MRSAILMLSLALMGCNDGGGSESQPAPTNIRITLEWAP